ncbi:MAG TPA: hypothetical protein PLA71_03970 [Saccharofermentans sp.]|nr:hypothetical protein [Saccharofermentans sp.]
MSDTVTMNAYINDYTSKIEREITVGSSHLMDLTNIEPLSNYFYHYCRDYKIPIINQLKLEFIEPGGTQGIDMRTLYIARDLQYQLFTNLPYISDMETPFLPTSWDEVFLGNTFNVIYIAPFQFNIVFIDGIPVGTAAPQTTFSSNKILNDIFQNLNLGYELSYKDAYTGMWCKVYIHKGRIDSSESINSQWSSGTGPNCWSTIDINPVINSKNREKLTKLYSPTQSEIDAYNNATSHAGGIGGGYSNYLCLSPAPDVVHHGGYITESFDVSLNDIDSAADIIISPIVYVGNIVDAHIAPTGMAYLTNSVGKAANAKFKKPVPGYQSITIYNLDVNYNPETLQSGGRSWVGDYKATATDDTTIVVDVVLEEEPE